MVLGAKPEEGSVVLQSNDYLAISNHQSIRDAQILALQSSDRDIVMSATFLHRDGDSTHTFEDKLARFVGYEHCFLAQSGWAANVGVIQTALWPDTPVYIDFFAHMSLWEGARVAQAAIHPFVHNSTNKLERLIKKHGPGLILVDSVYSTLGTVAPIEEIATISKHYGCALLVDESHSLGTHGPNGAGLVAELGLTSEVDFLTASLAKAFAYRAGVVLSSYEGGKLIPYVSHPAIFSSALLPYETETLKATLELIRKSDQRRSRLFEQSNKLISGLRSLGYRIRSESQIVSIETGTDGETEMVRDQLEEAGIFGSVFCAPATPKNRGLIRFSMNSDVSDDDIERIVRACSLLQSEFVA